MTDDPRPYHHGDLRAALLAAAEAELADKGIEAFSLRAVAKRAGVSHAAPAHHFGDVTGLLTALAAEGFHTFLASMTARTTPDAPPETRLEAAGLGYVDFAMARPALFRLIFSSSRPDFTDPALSDAADAAYGHLVALVAELGGSEPDVLAIWATAHGAADLLAGGRLKGLDDAPPARREAMLRAMLSRVMPRPGG
jgi:AcrR family transcriptional regulator